MLLGLIFMYSFSSVRNILFFFQMVPSATIGFGYSSVTSYVEEQRLADSVLLIAEPGQKVTHLGGGAALIYKVHMGVANLFDATCLYVSLAGESPRSDA